MKVTVTLHDEALINFVRAMEVTRIPIENVNWRQCLAWNIIKLGSLAIAQAGWFHIGDDVAFDVRNWTPEEKAAAELMRAVQKSIREEKPAP